LDGPFFYFLDGQKRSETMSCVCCWPCCLVVAERAEELNHPAPSIMFSPFSLLSHTSLSLSLFYIFVFYFIFHPASTGSIPLLCDTYFFLGSPPFATETLQDFYLNEILKRANTL
jgi:hypothetical protein